MYYENEFKLIYMFMYEIDGIVQIVREYVIFTFLAESMQHMLDDPKKY
jgi:hypothetical protein